MRLTLLQIFSNSDQKWFLNQIGGHIQAVNCGSDYVFCVELSAKCQVGNKTVVDLVGATSRRHGGLDEWHTWTQDDVTNLGLIYKWCMEECKVDDSRMRFVYCQRLYWGYCLGYYSLDNITFTDLSGSVPQDQVNACVSYVKANKSAWIGKGYLYYEAGDLGKQRSIRVWLEPNNASVRLHKYLKTTSDTCENASAIVAANSAYSLVGAEYTLYTDAACTNVVLDADANTPIVFKVTEASAKEGYSTTAKIKRGQTYYAKETKAPTGYVKSNDVISVFVATSQASTDSVFTVDAGEDLDADPLSIRYGKSLGSDAENDAGEREAE